jgi:purine nucleoside permease
LTKVDLMSIAARIMPPTPRRAVLIVMLVGVAGAGMAAAAPAAGPSSAAPPTAGQVTVASVESAPVGAAPVESAPVESAPVGAAPVESAPVESAPVGAAPVAAPPAPMAVKVMIINMFQLEAAPWIAALRPEQRIPVKGLSADYPDVRCTSDGVCQMTTGMGHANAAASLMALIYSGSFDLRESYFLIAGIAGIDPHQGTIGSAAWARYVVDTGIAHEIDARELPPGWQDGYFGVMTDSPTAVPRLEYRTEVYRLDDNLLQQAMALSRHAALEDGDDLRAYRQHYGFAPADRPPTVIQCDTASADTWWAGRRLGEHAARWTRLLTDGQGTYCTSQQEDNATLNALTRGARSGLLHVERVAVLRTASDFDRPYSGQSVLESLQAQRKLAGAIQASTDNLVRAGMPLVLAITNDWARWRTGAPPVAPP